jgi:hypothetical protein
LLSRSELLYLDGHLNCDRDYEYVLQHRLKTKILALGRELPLLLRNDGTRDSLATILQGLTDFRKSSMDKGLREEAESSPLISNSGGPAGIWTQDLQLRRLPRYPCSAPSTMVLEVCATGPLLKTEYPIISVTLDREHII